MISEILQVWWGTICDLHSSWHCTDHPCGSAGKCRQQVSKDILTHPAIVFVLSFPEGWGCCALTKWCSPINLPAFHLLYKLLYQIACVWCKSVCPGRNPFTYHLSSLAQYTQERRHHFCPEILGAQAHCVHELVLFPQSSLSAYCYFKSFPIQHHYPFTNMEGKHLASDLHISANHKYIYGELNKDLSLLCDGCFSGTSFLCIEGQSHWVEYLWALILSLKEENTNQTQLLCETDYKVNISTSTSAVQITQPVISSQAG